MPPAEKKHRVVIADDVRLSLEMEKTFFQRSGFEVFTANDGLTALALTVAEEPDLVILDEFMPGLKGSEVCMRLRVREETKGVPIIVTSINDGEELREACRLAGVDSFVPKAAGRDALLRVIATILQVPQRKSLRIPVFFTVVGMVGAKETLGKAVDLSEGGMCMEANRRYSVGSILDLRFYLPGDRRKIEASARIARTLPRGGDGYALGLEFDEIREGGRQRLNEYIDRALATY